MTEYPSQFELEEDSINLKETISKYFRYWPWFIVSLVLSFIVALIFLRNTPKTYQSVAQIKILDESKELELDMDGASLLGKPKINLENEGAVLKSHRLISQVVESLGLTTSYYIPGNFSNIPVWNPPINVKAINDSIRSTRTYTIHVTASGYSIWDEDESENPVQIQAYSMETPVAGLPFIIKATEPETIKQHIGTTYIVKLKSLYEASRGLSNELVIDRVGKASEILSLTLKGENKEKSEAILNKIIEQFNMDGIKDRQLVSQRTVDFVDDRFVYLASELDSIETDKKNFKKTNNLSYIEADAELSVQKKSTAEDQVFKQETQIELAQLLKNTLNNGISYSLLPADIGLENNGINILLGNYNSLVLEREKLRTSAGDNNPSLVVVTEQLESLRRNISNSIDAYLKQLSVSLDQLKIENSRASGVVSSMPEKEKILRSIERQQNIKESLYLLLLQKREEAAINLAVTSPSIKVVDYALTDARPVSPNKNIVFGGAFLVGLLLPIGILYLRFLTDTKVNDRDDLQKAVPSIPIVGEVPYIGNKSSKQFVDLHDRSVLAESFRILATNINYMLPETDSSDGRVIYVTSTIKGEGKTFTAINLSLALASFNNRVLIIGADLRNPKLHTFLNISKDMGGLADYLYGNSNNWHKLLLDGPIEIPDYKVLPGGAVPFNAAELLSNKRFKKLLEEAKQEFDYVIVDTAPTMLVTDTLLISRYADATLFLTRANYTEKKLLDFAQDLKKHNKLKNMMFVVNGVGEGKTKAYGYNYGYSYGYGQDGRSGEGPWYKRVFKK